MIPDFMQKFVLQIWHCCIFSHFHLLNIFGIKSGKICSERIFFLLRRNEQRRSNIAHTDRVSFPWKRHGAWKRPVDEPATEQREILNPKTLGRKKKRFFNVSCSFLRISALCVIFTKKNILLGEITIAD